jgi:hypothetical protein
LVALVFFFGYTDMDKQANLTMLFTDSVYVGIDPASGRKAFAYAALDRDLNLVTLADGELEDLTAFLGAQQSALVAVTAPLQVNQGLVRRKLESQSLTPGMHVRGADMRLAEYDLRERGITVTGTPGRAESCPAWMQLGFDLYKKLAKMGFVPYPQDDAPYQYLETNPHACFCALLDQLPLSKPTLEGRLQRQLVLHEHRVRVKDPMDFFEEITRHRLMKGILPTDLIYATDMLDVIAAAYTAWLAAHRPEQIVQVGDPSEGQISVPGRLKAKY